MREFQSHAIRAGLFKYRRLLRPLGVATAASAAVGYALFDSASASVWCFFAAVASAYLVYVVGRLPEPSGEGDRTGPQRSGICENL